MLSLPKHFCHAARITNSSGVAEMLRQAQHDVLLVRKRATYIALYSFQLLIFKSFISSVQNA